MNLFTRQFPRSLRRVVWSTPRKRFRDVASFGGALRNFTSFGGWFAGGEGEMGSSAGPSTYQTPALKVGFRLSQLYEQHVLPLEKAYNYEKFYTPSLSQTDFLAKPVVMVLGQYSVGKTTFIKYLLEREFPGMNIGPEPTTDKFTAIMHGPNGRTIPGNAASVQADLPFHSFKKYGQEFLSKFEVVEVNSPILEHVTFVDTPGVLSGEKQRVNRGYEFPAVVRHWASRADRVLLLFDAHTLDISDELRDAIHALKGNDEKVRCVLNKADSTPVQKLMRVYGALMWSMGRISATPEVVRVYVGSFHDEPYKDPTYQDLFDKERQSLRKELQSLPKNSAIRKINEFVKRAQRVKVHALVMTELQREFGWSGKLYYKQSRQDEILPDLPLLFDKIAKKHQLHHADLPDPDEFARVVRQTQLQLWDIPTISKHTLADLESSLANDLPALFVEAEMIPNPDTQIEN